MCVENMAKNICLKSTKASTAMPNAGKPLPRDLKKCIDPKIRFYEMEDGGKTEEGE